ncbi:response regulator [Dictyobacter arantiisoli]|uniref:DNA-binding response regulator n=1 Tax=Dictyobacter arantiisoli TaxID=2014874 RepID=A0A5A5T7L0_9CHLR|nr:response regulator transcription factor [Dictyobacter arantiisoli]GCF07196.1 DNA-binding response regulator [Dictyobacter arantiisoli]
MKTSNPVTIVTILLADDHAMMREGTRKLLEEDPRLKVIGEAQDGEEVLTFCQQTRPDVVILDISMKRMNGFSAAQALLTQSSQPPSILVLTAYDQIAYVQTMLKFGVKGYWLKSASGRDIRQAIHDIAQGKRSLAPEIHQLLADEGIDSSTPTEPLTSREIEVLRLVIQGLRNTEISKRLMVSVKTIETHLTSLYGKLGVQSRAEAIALAQRQGLLLES